MSDVTSQPVRNPAIVAPVSRHLSVADIERSLAFYRDVLGFEVRALPTGDGFAGAVRLFLVPHGFSSARNKTRHCAVGELRPRGSAVLFFQSEDVAAMREAVIAVAGSAERPGKGQLDQDADVRDPRSRRSPALVRRIVSPAVAGPRSGRAAPKGTARAAG